jgi:O-antigen ligase
MAIERRGAVFALVIAIASSVALGMAVSGSRVWAWSLPLLMVAACVVVVVVEHPVAILGAWLALAPFVHSPSGSGHINLLLYIAPPLLLGVVAVLADRGHGRLGLVDCAPGAFALYVVLLALARVGPYTAPSTADLIRTVYESLLIGPLVYYILLRYGQKPRSQRLLTGILLLSGAAVSSMVLFERWSGWTLWGDAGWHRIAVARMVGPFQNPAVAGTFIGVTLVLGAAVLMYGGPRSLRWAAGAAVALGLPAVYLTQTRACVIAVVLSSLGLLVAQRRFRLATAMALTLAVVAVASNWQTVEASRLYRLRVDNTTTAETRVELTRWSLELAAAKPLIGWGVESFDLVKKTASVQAANAASPSSEWATSHNSFLTILVEFGAIGFTLFLYPWVAITYAAVRRIRLSTENRWLLVGCIAMLSVCAINELFIDMRFFSYTSMLPWLVLGMARSALREDA